MAGYAPRVRDDRRALRALHAARRRRYLTDLDWVDSLYKTYVTAIVSGAAAFFSSRLFGEHPLDAGSLADVRHDGPAVIGLAIAARRHARLALGCAAVDRSRSTPPTSATCCSRPSAADSCCATRRCASCAA